MIVQVGNDLSPRQLRNGWLFPCAASTLPSVGLEICASCATRGTCIRTHLFPTPYREAAITGFGDHPNASITRCIAGCLRFFTLIQSRAAGSSESARRDQSGDISPRSNPAAERATPENRPRSGQMPALRVGTSGRGKVSPPTWAAAAQSSASPLPRPAWPSMHHIQACRGAAVYLPAGHLPREG